MVDANLLVLPLDIDNGDDLARTRQGAELDNRVIGVGVAQYDALGRADGLDQCVHDAHAALYRA
ncbi:hypothetical protein D3C72_2455980 [compost metagenome]